MTTKLTNPFFISATFGKCFLILFPNFHDLKITYNRYNNRITTSENDNVQSHEQDESKLDNYSREQWCLHTYT